MKTRIGLMMAGVLLQQLLLAQKMTFNAQLDGLQDTTVRIGYVMGEKSVVDTLTVNDGKFSWSADISEPIKLFLLSSKQYFTFYAEPGEMMLTGIADSIESYQVKGSETQLAADAFRLANKDIEEEQNQLYTKYGKGTDEEQSALEKRLRELGNVRKERVREYIAAHPSEFYSLMLVSEHAGYGGEYAEVKKMQEMLDKKLLDGNQGKIFLKRLEVMKRSAMGTKVIDFAQQDTSGRMVKSAAFKGKYVLLDFWASWCGPCRAENPNVLEAYNEFKDRNFIVVGVSLDDHKENWKKAIRDDKMPWVQLSDLKGWKNELSTYYGIQGIPSNFLLDPSGNIVAKDLRGRRLHEKLAELLK